MVFQITQQNLEAVLDQYSGNRQPTDLAGCYDTHDLRVNVPAPSRVEMQRVVHEYDIKHCLDNSELCIGFDRDRLYVVGKTIYDAPDSVLGDLHDLVSVGLGVTLFTSRREYSFLSAARAEGDLSRITAVFPIASRGEDESDSVGEFTAFGETVRFRLEGERVDSSLTHYKVIQA